MFGLTIRYSTSSGARRGLVRNAEVRHARWPRRRLAPHISTTTNRPQLRPHATLVSLRYALCFFPSRVLHVPLQFCAQLRSPSLSFAVPDHVYACLLASSAAAVCPPLGCTCQKGSPHGGSCGPRRCLAVPFHRSPCVVLCS